MKVFTLDIVSDVVCPWCAIGYKRLEQAMETLKGEIEFKIDWHPFELNPQMPPEGEEIFEHLSRKYGLTQEAALQNQTQIASLGQELGLNAKEASDVIASGRYEDEV